MDEIFISVEDGLEELRAGKMLIVVDDEDRENEGDIIMAAEKVTPEAVNFMATYGRGLVCQAITRERAKELDLPLMEKENTSLHSTAFTVSVDARGVTTTGISTHDRAATIKRMIDTKCRPQDLLRPGHIFPLVAKAGGVLERNGHTETALEMARMAGFYPSGVLCEIMDNDGRMAKIPRLVNMARKFDLRILTVKSVVDYRKRNERGIVTRISEARLPTDFGEFRLILYSSILERGLSHFALVKGDPGEQNMPLVRVHSECLTGGSLFSLRCDCGYQLRHAMKLIQQEGGVIVYLRQEGRGIGFDNKIRAYSLQDRGYDTVKANLHLGFPADTRDYTSGAKILEDLGIRRVRLLTNNPEKIAGLENCGIQVSERIPLEAEPNKENKDYLVVKKLQLGHLLSNL